MIEPSEIYPILQGAFEAFTERDSLCVPTHCIYPSGEFVRVNVYGSGQSFVVSDEGRAVREIELVGEVIESPDSLIKSTLKQLGVTSRNGVIRSRSVSREELPFAIACVANASKGSSEWLFAHYKVPSNRDFKAMLRRFLEVSFPASVHSEKLIGSSNKPHKFESIISVSSGKRIIVDPVVHDSSAINARVVANMDIQRARIPGVEQRIVYDDLEDWSADELNLLQFGAPVVPYSKLPEVLGRLAA